jgi:hypothetical protein
LFEKQGGSENQQRADEEFFHGVAILNLRLARQAKFCSRRIAREPDAKRARKTDGRIFEIAIGTIVADRLRANPDGR